jgi:hypothetical protein
VAHSLVPPSVEGHVNRVRDIAPKYWKGASDLTVRNRLTFYIMNRYGRMSFNARSHSQVWNAKIKQPQVLPLVDNVPLEFVNQDTDIQFYIGIKGMGVTDTMPELEYLLAQGAPEQIVDRYNRKSADMTESLEQRLQKSFYTNGNDAANAYDYVGIKTALGHGAVAVGDKVAVPSGTYAGQSIALASNGGTWSAALATPPNSTIAKDWPFGQGSSEYDGTSSMTWNYSSSQFGTSSTTWEDNAVRCVTEAATALVHRGGYANGGGAPLVCVMASEMFIALKHSFRSQNRQLMPYRDGDLGFPQDTIMVDGILFMSDYNVPAGEAYMFAPQYMEMFNVHPNIYKEYGPEFSMIHRGFLYMATAYGNFKWQPKYLVKFISQAS